MMHDEALQFPPLPMPLPVDPRDLPAHDAVAIYLMALQAPADPAQAEQGLALLATGERARWRDIRPKEHRWQYLQSRVLLRLVLGAYVDDDPRALAFTRDRWGRPSLATQKELHFSLARCASYVALAIGSDPVLGVDVAAMVPMRCNFMRFAHRFFHPADLAQLLACPATCRYGRFLELWTLKGAHRKALGLGTHKPMADCGFTRTAQGVIVAHDRAPVPGLAMPDAFIAQRRMRGCQLSVAYRRGRPVRFRYLNGAASLPWPGSAPCNEEILPRQPIT